MAADAGPDERMPMEREPLRSTRESDAKEFAAAMLDRAAGAGLLTPTAGGLRGVENYLLLSHSVVDPRYGEADPPVPRWRECATLLGRYTTAVAVGDYDVFDAVVERDERAEHRRVTEAARYLAARLSRPDDPVALPDIAGRDLVRALGEEYADLVRTYRARAHPQVLADWTTVMAQLLHGMARYRTVPHPVFPFELLRDLASGAVDVPGALARVTQRHPEGAVPEVLLGHLAALMASPDPDDRDELLLLLRTAEEGRTAGAGAYLQTVALHGPPHEVTGPALRALRDASWLADYGSRLANHRSDVNNRELRASGHEEHSGERVWYCLLSEAAGETFADHDLPPDHARRVLRACLRAENRLADAFADSVRALWRAWPWVGATCGRMGHVGNRPYDVGHYALLSDEGFSALFAELDHRAEGGFLTRCRPGWTPPP
ncbi:hypothetical protein ACFVVL_01360 [Kitasatospora sp. NPDC058115]|uniref:hypothetical protein n=1 Tax=Kitasatospora sp. NPDC058115 TaxID=3346347 RepID=UPI0036DDC855